MSLIPFNEILDIITMISSVGMLILTIGALVWILRSPNRIKTWSNIIVFLLLILSQICETALWSLGVKDRNRETKTAREVQSALFAGQFIF